MNLIKGDTITLRQSKPRSRGDEPINYTQKVELDPKTPLTRG